MKCNLVKCQIDQISVDNHNIPEIMKSLIDEYNSLFSPKKNQTSCLESKVKHCIETTSNSPTFAKVRQLSAEKYESAKQEFTNLLKNGIIQPSKSPYASPLHMVPKADGTWRSCGDYRVLNSITKPDRYPMKNIKCVSSKLAHKTVFSKLDLMSAYQQIPMNKNDIEKTAVITPFGLFEYKFMPYGLRNAAATFQRFMDNIFLNCDFAFVYLDDILIFSETPEQHLEHLEIVFKILKDNGLRVNISKCKFFKNKIDYLGHTITPEGMLPSESKVKEILDFPEPTDSKGLRRFLGMIGFYRRLIPNFAYKVLPLTDKMKDNQKPTSITFSEEESESFRIIKEELSSLSALAHPDSAATEYHLVTDSSKYAIGSALHQIVDGQPIPLGFYSKKLTVSQQSWSTFDRELYAAFMAILHFKPDIEGRHVTLFTDHKPLIRAYRKQTPLNSDKQQRQMSIVSEYVADIVYIRGQDNIVADCLSRPSINAVSIDLVDLPGLAEQQSSDVELQTVKENLKSFKIGDKELLCDVSTPYPRPYVPKVSRNRICETMHNISHPSIKTTVKLIKSRYYWPSMDKEIRLWTRNCVNCQRSKIHRHTKTPTVHFDLPSSRFETIHIDIVGPLPTAIPKNATYPRPERYLLTMIDRTTKWLEATPMVDITSQTVASAFYNTWISKFGVPLHVITDRGSQFESELFRELAELVGFHRLRTTAYHPECNGEIERQHRTLKTAIIARKENWIDALPSVLLGMRITPLENGYSPTQLVYGTQILTPSPIITLERREFDSNYIRDLQKMMSEVTIELEARQQRKLKNAKSYVPKDLKNCTHVWLRIDRVRKSLEAPYSGPYKVLARTEKFFTIELPNGDKNNVSIDRLKPARIPLTEDSAQEPSEQEEAETAEQDQQETVNAEDDQDQIQEVEDDFGESSEPTTSTRSGRRVTFKRQDDYMYF